MIYYKTTAPLWPTPQFTTLTNYFTCAANKYPEYTRHHPFKSNMKMSCNGCRILRKGCTDNCVIRPCLEWINSPESQANATLFLAKFYGRTALLNLIAAAPPHLRPGDHHLPTLANKCYISFPSLKLCLILIV